MAQADSQRFGARLEEAVDQFGPLCAGIDPHEALLDAWGLSVDAEGLGEFADRCVEAYAGRVALVKPQAAFFERFGAAGVAVLERTLDALREADTLTLLDVKRGDIGSTMAAYASAHLGPQAPTHADAITVSPFLGFGSLDPALDLAEASGDGVFVLALTSNPEGGQVQHARGDDGRTVAESIIAAVTERNAGEGRFGDTGLVVGATTGKDIADLGLAEALAASRAPLLAPGLGAQGATADGIARAFGPAAGLVLPTSSRAILAAGPDLSALRDAVTRTAGEVAAALPQP
ncbi:orotidine-5'-phosphate decarboxylase [Metallococcus carri]|uniref:orotidine-5'-phosphate decarboxylase n=1 Tax=Metallococcus carri TaxID=1656884 RepID=UPI002E296CFA|nr:orotidine-5'-phosphate decarboxylase [Metallococcus carri]